MSTTSSISASGRSALATRRPITSTVWLSETTARRRPSSSGATRSASRPSSVSAKTIALKGTAAGLPVSRIGPASVDHLGDQRVPVGRLSHRPAPRNRTGAAFQAARARPEIGMNGEQFAVAARAPRIGMRMCATKHPTSPPRHRRWSDTSRCRRRRPSPRQARRPPPSPTALPGGRWRRPGSAARDRRPHRRRWRRNGRSSSPAAALASRLVSAWSQG